MSFPLFNGVVGRSASWQQYDSAVMQAFKRAAGYLIGFHVWIIANFSFAHWHQINVSKHLLQTKVI